MEKMTDKGSMKEPVTVSYLVYRDTICHDRRIIDKLVIALICTVVLMFGTNLAWLLVWNSYEFVSDEITVDSEDSGIANYTGGNGGITFGEDYNTPEIVEEEGEQGN